MTRLTPTRTRALIVDLPLFDAGHRWTSAEGSIRSASGVTPLGAGLSVRPFCEPIELLRSGSCQSKAELWPISNFGCSCTRAETDLKLVPFFASRLKVVWLTVVTKRSAASISRHHSTLNEIITISGEKNATFWELETKYIGKMIHWSARKEDIWWWSQWKDFSQKSRQCPYFF